MAKVPTISKANAAPKEPYSFVNINIAGGRKSNLNNEISNSGRVIPEACKIGMALLETAFNSTMAEKTLSKFADGSHFWPIG